MIWDSTLKRLHAELGQWETAAVGKVKPVVAGKVRLDFPKGVQPTTPEAPS